MIGIWFNIVIRDKIQSGGKFAGDRDILIGTRGDDDVFSVVLDDVAGIWDGG